MNAGINAGIKEIEDHFWPWRDLPMTSSRERASDAFPLILRQSVSIRGF